MIPTILPSGRATTMETAKRSVVSRALEKGMKTRGTGDFRVVKLGDDPIVMNDVSYTALCLIHLYIFSWLLEN